MNLIPVTGQKIRPATAGNALPCDTRKIREPVWGIAHTARVYFSFCFVNDGGCKLPKLRDTGWLYTMATRQTHVR